MKLEDQAQLVEFGVDWLTVTAVTDEKRRRLLRIGRDILSEAQAAGDELSVWNWKSYEGWTSGSCEVGVRDDSCMVRVHGATAQENHKLLVAFAENCTRLDVQATYRLCSETVDHALARAWRSARCKKHYGKPINWHYRRDASRGNTLEYGRRVSEKFGRAYDKAKESRLDHYRNCIRFEYEIKGDTAFNTMCALRRRNFAQSVLTTCLYSFFHDRGVSLGHLPNDGSLIECGPSRRDVDRYLSWLAKCVRKGVRRSIAERGIDVTLEALGLTDFVRPVPKRTSLDPNDEKEVVNDDGI